MNEDKRRRGGWTRSSWKVKRVLERNRALLRAWRNQHPDGGTPNVSEQSNEWLTRRGFDFQFHTHVTTTDDGKLAVMCYDEGYILDDGEIRPFDEAASRSGSASLSRLAR